MRIKTVNVSRPKMNKIAVYLRHRTQNSWWICDHNHSSTHAVSWLEFNPFTGYSEL